MTFWAQAAAVLDDRILLRQIVGWLGGFILLIGGAFVGVLRWLAVRGFAKIDALGTDIQTATALVAATMKTALTEHEARDTRQFAQLGEGLERIAGRVTESNTFNARALQEQTKFLYETIQQQDDRAAARESARNQAVEEVRRELAAERQRAAGERDKG